MNDQRSIGAAASTSHEEATAMATNQHPLTSEDFEALANALILSVAPGRVTGITTSGDRILVTSTLASPFADKGPSEWLTVLSRVDGHTISCEVTIQCQPLSPEAIVEAYFEGRIRIRDFHQLAHSNPAIAEAYAVAIDPVADQPPLPEGLSFEPFDDLTFVPQSGVVAPDGARCETPACVKWDGHSDDHSPKPLS